MPAYFRIKEITAPATIVRQGINVQDIHLGDFIYPEEIDTIVCVNEIVYWDDSTGEHFTWTPGETPATVVVPKVPAKSVTPAPVVETPEAE